MKQNPRISLKKPEHLKKSRKNAMDLFVIYSFYDQLQHLYEKHELKGLEKSSFIFNCNESGFGSDPTRVRALGEKGIPFSRFRQRIYYCGGMCRCRWYIFTSTNSV